MKIKAVPSLLLKARQWPTVRHFFKHAPFAMAASALPGAVNYLIILYLAFNLGLEAIGTYRLLFSVFSLCGLASMMETNKIFLRAIVSKEVGKEKQAPAFLLINRFCHSLAVVVLLVSTAMVGLTLETALISPPILYIALLAAIIFPFDSYRTVMQAGHRFRALLLMEAAKHSAALGIFIVALQSGYGVEKAIVGQIAVIAFFHCLYSAIAVRPLVQFDFSKKNIRLALASKPARQARTYSYAGLLPSSLEHLDKLLVGWVFGLEFLGVYTLAYSTGRVVYNFIKPAIIIYYRRFVSAMPNWQILFWVGITFTLFGLLSAALFVVGINNFPALAEFRSGAIVTIILFLSYGIGMVRAVYGQAYTLNATSNPRHALLAASQATGLSLLLLGVALLSSPSTALVLLALQYPVRDGVTVALMARYRRQHQ